MGELIAQFLIFLMIYLPLGLGLVLALAARRRDKGREPPSPAAVRRAYIMVGLGFACIALDTAAHGFQWGRLIWPILLVAIAAFTICRK